MRIRKFFEGDIIRFCCIDDVSELLLSQKPPINRRADSSLRFIVERRKDKNEKAVWYCVYIDLKFGVMTAVGSGGSYSYYNLFSSGGDFVKELAGIDRESLLEGIAEKNVFDSKGTTRNILDWCKKNKPKKYQSAKDFFEYCIPNVEYKSYNQYFKFIEMNDWNNLFDDLDYKEVEQWRYQADTLEFADMFMRYIVPEMAEIANQNFCCRKSRL